MKIGFASGKGGTGKTTFAVNLASVIEKRAILFDCDVEEPNAHLFLPFITKKEIAVYLPLPQIDETICTACGACIDFCAYSAIAILGTTALVFPEMCHACGGCIRLCPVQAIKETQRRIGVINVSKHRHVTLVTGRLDIGIPQAPPLIRAVKKYMESSDWVIIDAPPGTSCPVITAVRDVDLVILVTEPTPFGKHDLEMAVTTLREIGIPMAVVLNRADIGDVRIHDFCDEENIPIIGELPNDRRIAEIYSRGHLIVDVLPEYRIVFQQLANNIEKIMKERNFSHANI